MTSSLAATYGQALSDYLRDGSEAQLQRAYEIGREAVRNGSGLLELQRAHDAGIRQVIRDAKEVETALSMIQGANRHLAEALAPFEMALRGYRDANEELRDLNRVMKEQSARLARSNADLEQFAYVASHDLQEPLRMVASFVKLLERRYGDRLDDDAREFIGFAVDGANRMQALINDLLEFSRVGSRGGEFRCVDLAEVIDRVESILVCAIDEAGAEISHGVLPTVWADDTQMGQLLQNLIGNALKFRGSAPPRIHVGCRNEDGEAVIFVRDNGIGIDPRFREQAFKVFRRLQAREDYPGTGIGLAICRRIVERHGGRIWIDPTAKQGTTFCFTLPQPSQGGKQPDGASRTTD